MGLCLNRPAAAVAHQDYSDSDLDEAEADYWLPPGSGYGSWRLRERPDLESEVIGVVIEGERFRAVLARLAPGQFMVFLDTDTVALRSLRALVAAVPPVVRPLVARLLDPRVRSQRPAPQHDGYPNMEDES